MKPSAYQIAQVRNAIVIMRDACDHAEHELTRDRTPEKLIAAVNHTFLWGLANASMGIESALASVSCERERLEVERESV